ncbi:MAG: Uma2 family endonuclease [Desertifilum sp.]|nr:Uma2 family endonuclease [Desertifilum sp.]
MNPTATELGLPPPFPDHTQLPESDGTFVKNFQEHPQSILLTDSLGPLLAQRHPDGRYCIGQDSGIYWRETDPPEAGAVAPDWFYVPNVPARPERGSYRRSYVFWREYISPLITIELASGKGEEERNATPLLMTEAGEVQKPGKFWVYEQILHITYYAIYEIVSNRLEAYRLVEGRYQPITPNERGHYFIPPLEIELGLWQGTYQNQTQQWLRWWDKDGNLLLIGSERAEREKLKTEQERQRAEQAEQKAARLAERLRAMGIDPDNLD